MVSLFSLREALAGHLHFDDLRANLPAKLSLKYAIWQGFCSQSSTGSCAAV